MYQVNPMELIQMIRSGKNPQQLMLSVLEGQMGGTPMGANLLNLARNGQTREIEQIARNLSQQQGIDFDKEFANFCRMLGIKK